MITDFVAVMTLVVLVATVMMITITTVVKKVMYVT